MEELLAALLLSAVWYVVGAVDQCNVKSNNFCRCSTDNITIDISSVFSDYP